MTIPSYGGLLGVAKHQYNNTYTIGPLFDEIFIFLFCITSWEGLSARSNTDDSHIGMLHAFSFPSQVIVSAVAAYLHRRHLMIWGVFSPRFLYEGAFQVTSDICVIMVYLLITKLENQALY